MIPPAIVRARLGWKALRLASIVIAAWAIVACRRAHESGATRKNDAGAIATRIVSLSPSTTEALFAIGAGDRLVGRSRYCDYPPEVSKLPEIGGYVDPSFEAIMELSPDLVTGARGPAGAAMSDRLEARGIRTYLPKTESFDEITTMILGLGARTGRVEAATACVDALRGRLRRIEQALAGKARPKVLLVFGLQPLSAAGRATFADEMIRHAGGVNAITEGSGYPTLGIEQVLVIDPDVVIDAAMAEAPGTQRIGREAPGWRRVRAVSAGRVVGIGDESLLRPGPRIADGITILARAIHPEVSLP